MSHRISSQPTTAAQRVARAINNPNEPTACRTCGSIYFMDMTAQMYTSGSYGLRAVSTTPMKVFTCPCGEILTPAGLNNGDQAGDERDLFAQSLAAALAYRAQTGVDAAAKGVAGVHELQELRARIAELQTQIDQLSGLEPAPSEHLVANGGPVTQGRVSNACRTLHRAFKQMTTDEVHDGMALCIRPPCRRQPSVCVGSAMRSLTIMPTQAG